jgi:glucose-6-phosphate 1-dehydrogenase
VTEPWDPSGKPRSDALVLFAITGDLAHQKIFPALQAMVHGKNLDVPMVGVARSGRRPRQAHRPDAGKA